MANKKEFCSCGQPQSSPVPHEHDQTDREKAIIAYYAPLCTVNTRALLAIAKMPCLTRLLGEANDDCGCASCTAKDALVRHAAASRIIIPEVVIDILGGVADLHTKSKGVQVTIRDYDNQEDCGVSQEYAEEIWDESDEV